MHLYKHCYASWAQQIVSEDKEKWQPARDARLLASTAPQAQIANALGLTDGPEETDSGLSVQALNHSLQQGIDEDLDAPMRIMGGSDDEHGGDDEGEGEVQFSLNASTAQFANLATFQFVAP